MNGCFIILVYRRSRIKKALDGMIATKYCGGIPRGFAIPTVGECDEINHSKRQDQNRYKLIYLHRPGKYLGTPLEPQGPLRSELQ